MKLKNVLLATCSICGKKEFFELTDEEENVFRKYLCHGRQMGYLQDLFPRVPAWIRSGAIDKYSNGFCICPRCQEGNDDDDDY